MALIPLRLLGIPPELAIGFRRIPDHDSRMRVHAGQESKVLNCVRCQGGEVKSAACIAKVPSAAFAYTRRSLHGGFVSTEQFLASLRQGRIWRGLREERYGNRVCRALHQWVVAFCGVEADFGDERQAKQCGRGVSEDEQQGFVVEPFDSCDQSTSERVDDPKPRSPRMSAPRPVDQVNTFDVDRCLMLSERIKSALGRMGDGLSADAATDVSDDPVETLVKLTQPICRVVLVQLGSKVSDPLRSATPVGPDSSDSQGRLVSFPSRRPRRWRGFRPADTPCPCSFDP